MTKRSKFIIYRPMNMKFILLTFALIPALAMAQGNRGSNRFELLSGIRKSKDLKSQWDYKYSKQDYVFGKTPAKFLAENYHYIPEGSKVLDMGMGEGRNAVFLARKGYKVTGVDISSVAVRKARALAREFGVRIDTAVSSMQDYDVKKGTVDAIICFYYVERSLHNLMLSWLKPGGILIYEAHTEKQRDVKGSEHYSRKYLLKQGELLTLFEDMRVLKYEEPLHMKEYTTSIVLQKPL